MVVYRSRGHVGIGYFGEVNYPDMVDSGLRFGTAIIPRVKGLSSLARPIPAPAEMDTRCVPVRCANVSLQIAFGYLAHTWS